ncbi:MAG: uridine kinase [Chitinophagales bacterium]|nr:uridine kinase [Chitinophagales bacterium]MDW8274540.1 uridine kinase [Chitinophagales bacterium]
MIVIGITGGSGSGKTTVVRNILEKLDRNQVAVLSQDCYYKDNSHLPLEERKLLNFDHPDSIEFDLMVEHLERLKGGEAIHEPVYDFITSTRKQETRFIQPKHIIIMEGILLFADARLRDLCNVKVFVDADADDRLMRIIERDILERGRKLEEVLMRYETVKAMHLQFIEPTKRFADIIIPQGGMNHVAIDVLVSLINQKLQKYATAESS